MKIAQILKYEQLNRGMTQIEFANFLNIPRGTLSHHLKGRAISPSNLKKYSDKLNLDLAKYYIEE